MIGDHIVTAVALALYVAIIVSVFAILLAH